MNNYQTITTDGLLQSTGPKLGLFVFVLMLGALASCTVSLRAQDATVPSMLQKRAAEFKKPVIIKFDGMIDFRRTDYFNNRLARAESMGADLVILEIDSPGGYATLSLEIAEILRDVTWAYTIAYVPREAISGAALISLGCDEIVVGSQARFGDAGPIHFDPQLGAFRYVEAKAKSILVRQARDLAAAKSRPAELAEAMIDENAAVFIKKQDDEDESPAEFKIVYLNEQFPSPAEAAKRDQLDLDQWVLLEETGEDRFFTVNGPRAVELGLATFVADDRGELTRQLKATGELSVMDYSFTDDVVYWLNSSVATFFLILIGLIALYFELSAPGVGVGGLLAGLCAALFFWSRFFGGTAGWLEVLLFVAGLVFLVMELFVIPGFGFAGFLGLVMLFCSVVMASQDFIVPETEGDWSQLLNTLLIIVASSCVFLIGAVFISRKFGNVPVLNQLSLEPPKSEPTITQKDKDTGKPLPADHPKISVGDWGKAESLLRPAGRATFAGRSFDVVSDGSFLDPGTQVRVIEISGNRIVVSEIENNDQTVGRDDSGQSS